MLSKEQMQEVRCRLSNPENWNRNGQYWNGNTCACLVGMMALVSGQNVSDIDGCYEYKQMENDIRERYSPPKGNTCLFLEDWNDNIATHEDLLALLDRQIERMA